MIVYTLIDGLWQAFGVASVTPTPPPVVNVGYGRTPYGTGPYGE